MYGSGILRGLGVTLRHFVNTYIEDVKWGFRRHIPDEASRPGRDWKRAASSPWSIPTKSSPCRSASASFRS